MEKKLPKTHLIQLTADQVERAMNQLVEDIQSQWPDEQRAENVALFLSREFERNLLRRYVVHRIPDCDEVAWLLANDVRWNVKSSVDQFVSKHTLRVQVFDALDHKRFEDWLVS